MFKKKLIKFFTKTLVGRVVDKAILGGAVTSTTIKTPRTNEGQFDYKEFILELLTSTLPILLVIFLAVGWLDKEQVKWLWDLFF